MGRDRRRGVPGQSPDAGVRPQGDDLSGLRAGPACLDGGEGRLGRSPRLHPGAAAPDQHRASRAGQHPGVLRGSLR